MNETEKLYILLIIIFLTSAYDIRTRFKDCLDTYRDRRFTVITVIILHRVIWSFMYFGWTFNDRRVLILYLLFNVGLKMHWLTNDNECVVTQIERSLCNFPPDSYSDYLYNLLKEDTSLLYGSIQIFLCSIVIYKLYFTQDSQTTKNVT